MNDESTIRDALIAAGAMALMALIALLILIDVLGSAYEVGGL